MATITPGIAAPFTFGAALSWVQVNLGWLVDEVESFPGIPTSAPTAPFLPQNADRLALVMFNLGLNNLFVALNPNVNNTSGILLTANGGAVSLNVRDDFTLTTRAWFGISVTAPGTLYVLEIIGRVKLPPGTKPGY